jgi:hypothetical protein
MLLLRIPNPHTILHHLMLRHSHATHIKLAGDDIGE